MDKENVEVGKENVDPAHVQERKNNGVLKKRIAKVCAIRSNNRTLFIFLG